MTAGRRRLWLAAGWMEVILWLFAVIVYVIQTRPSNGADFGMYYAAAETLRFSPHSDVYLLRTLSDTVSVHGGCAPVSAWPFPYPYQPLLALLLEPLTLIPCQSAEIVWLCVNLALWFGVAGAYALKARREQGSVQALIATAMVVFFAPVLSGLYYGQVHLIVLLVIAIGMALTERDHEFAAGAALGFGAVLKYFPVILIVYYLLRGRWRVAIGAGAVSGAVVFVEFLIVGPRTMLESLGAGERDIRHYAAVYQGGHWMNALPGGALIGYLAGILFVTTVVWLRWRKAEQPQNEALGAGWGLVTMLMLSPLVWWFDMTWLLPALLVCLSVALRYARGAGSGRGWRWLASRWWPAATLAVCLGMFMFIPYEFHPYIPNYLMTSTGALLLWVLCGALYVRSAGVRVPRAVSWLRLGARYLAGRAASVEQSGALS